MPNFLEILIYKPMGIALNFFYGFFGNNFALSIFVFTLIINLILFPLNVKGQRTQMQSARIKPKLDALKEKYADDRRRLQEEQMELQRREGVSMTGGCLPMLIRLPFLWGIYNAVVNPLTNILLEKADVINQVKEFLAPLLEGKVKPASVTQLKIVENVESIAGQFPALAASIEKNLDFSWMGLNLAERPVFHINIAQHFRMIWIIPLLSFATAMLSSLVSMFLQKRTNPDAPNMGGMMLTMPVISLVIGFTVPGAVGFYWACSNIIGAGIQVFVQLFFNPNKLIAKDELKTIRIRRKLEKTKLAAVAASAE